MRDILFLILGLIIALTLTLVMPQLGNSIWNPPWVLMVLCAWVMVKKRYLGFLLPFLLGLVMDVMLGSPLGAHVLALLLPIFIVVILCKRVARYGVWQQALMILVLTLMYQLILVCIYGFMGMSPASYHYFLSPITAMMVWILMALPLKRVRR